MKAIYITGCFGFIGSYVTRQALEKGWYVRGVDKCTYAARKEQLIKEFSQYPKFSYEEKDIADTKSLFDCDFIINTAAETHVGNSIVDSDPFVHSNIKGVHSILEAIRNFRVEGNKKPILLHFSTDEVYGDIKEGNFTELDVLNPSNPYSATKAAADMLIKAWGRTYGINYIIVRPSNNYGIGQYVEKLIPKSVKYLTLNKKIPIHNGGLPVRTWLHAEDTASAVIHLISEGVKDEIYNISSSVHCSNANIVKKIIENFNGDSDFEKYLDLSYSRAGQDVRYGINDDKLRKTGWNNKKDLNIELPKIVDYYRNNFIW